MMSSGHNVTYSIQAPYLFLEWSNASYSHFLSYIKYSQYIDKYALYTIPLEAQIILYRITSIIGFVKTISEVHPIGC